MFINAYNSALLLAWDANCDVQFIGSKYMDAVDYVATYVGKGEGKSITGNSVYKYNTLNMFKKAWNFSEVLSHQKIFSVGYLLE